MRGKVEDPTEELKQMQEFKQNNGKQFNKDPNNAKKLDSLKSKLHTYQRSTDMSNKLNSIGLDDTMENNNKIFEQLLNDGIKATADNREVSSILKGPNGDLKMISIWTILGEEKYLSTTMLIPIK